MTTAGHRLVLGPYQDDQRIQDCGNGFSFTEPDGPRAVRYLMPGSDFGFDTPWVEADEASPEILRARGGFTYGVQDPVAVLARYFPLNNDGPPTE